MVLACRSAERGEAARRAIARDTGNDRLRLTQVDFASLLGTEPLRPLLARAGPAHIVVVASERDLDLGDVNFDRRR